MLSRGVVLTIGVLFHLIYLRTIFDIYFKSPVVSVGQQFSSLTDHVPPADRLFLIVGDGLRADKLFENPDLAPYLHEKATEDGRWGISHTRVPTESRPGHVAMIAGLYEDVSAVTTGWKLNPLNFDSVLNQSSRTYAWGSPDILPMFREGASDKDRISCSMYDAEDEDFTEDSGKLDTWVFERVENLFEQASRNATLMTQLKSPKTVFFLHLLGLDVAGHAHRPYSREYLNNIATVDRGISSLMKALELHLGQEDLDRTAFLFTADHGMSDWGSHGDGHPDNTRTPFITWGAGVKTPGSITTRGRASLETHRTSNEVLGWIVEKTPRFDLAQADLSVLMSYLIGINYPKNNVGSLPIELLTSDEAATAKALFQNARQIHAQYSAKSALKASQLHLSKLVEFDFTRDYENEGQVSVQTASWRELESLSEAWILESLEGMRYLQRYDWLFLRSVVTLGYIGWMLFSLTFLLKTYVLPFRVLQSTNDTKSHVNGHAEISKEHTGRWEMLQSQSTATIWSFSTISILVLAYLLERSAPISHYAYAAFPLFFWFRVSSDLPQTLIALHARSLGTDHSLRDSAGLVLLGALIVQGIVQVYSNRRVISVMWPLASVTPFFYPQIPRKAPLTTASWVVLCIAMATFTSLPTVQVESIRSVVAGGIIMFFVGLLYILFGSANFITGAQVGLVALATVVTEVSSKSLARKQGLPLGAQVLGWVVLAASLILPIVHRLRASAKSDDYQHRLMGLFLMFAPTFIILSISYEGLFYLVFWALLYTWIELESQISSLHAREDGKERVLRLTDARIALYFFFLIQAAFFGTGNIASVSSFGLDSVYRLIPVFSPFTMAALLMFKLLAPFAVISATLGILNKRLRIPESGIFMTVLTFCDLLTLNFFWMVRDEGSWLEIGSSISAFVIAGILVLFVVSLEKLSQLIV